METTSLAIGQHHIQIHGFADNLDILEDSLEDTKKAARMLEQIASI